MEYPTDINLPFFAYGLFRPGQLIFFQLRDLVCNVREPVEVVGRLFRRGGLILIETKSQGCVQGALLTFINNRKREAYDRILAMELDKQYRWGRIQADGFPANVLIGCSPNRGADHFNIEKSNLDGWNDPLFTDALDVVEKTLLENSKKSALDMEAFFSLQMAYLLLWSSIERYVSLRYNLGDKVVDKISKLASESAFAESLCKYVKTPREVFRIDRPAQKEILNPDAPDKALRYYYQVRSNITHRGKSTLYNDFKMLQDSLKELLLIFRNVLQKAEKDAQYVLTDKP